MYLRSFVWERVGRFPDACLFVCLVSSTDPPHAGSNYFGVPPQLHMYTYLEFWLAWQSPLLSSVVISLSPLSHFYLCLTFD